MKKRGSFGVGILVLIIFSFSPRVMGEDKAFEKRRAQIIENFVASSRKSDGDYSTISLKNWRSELGLPIMSTEDMVRKILNTFEIHYKNLKVVDYLIVYTNKPGPSDGIECDFLIIHHELKPERVYRFGTKEKEE